MLRTPALVRALLEQAGYVWDVDLDAWHRRGESPSALRGRMLDAEIARSLTPEQVKAWIEAGESE